MWYQLKHQLEVQLRNAVQRSSESRAWPHPRGWLCAGCGAGTSSRNAACELVVKLELQYCHIEARPYELLSWPCREILFFFCRNTAKDSASLMPLHWEQHWHKTLKAAGRETLSLKNILLYLQHRIAKHLDKTLLLKVFILTSKAVQLQTSTHVHPTAAVYHAHALYTNLSHSADSGSPYWGV